MPQFERQKFQRFCEIFPEQPWPVSRFQKQPFLYKHRIARDSVSMASKKFKVDKKVLAAATLNVLVPGPKLIPEGSVERDPSKAVETRSAGSSTGARPVQLGPKKREPAEGVAPPAKCAKETLQSNAPPAIEKETGMKKEVGDSKTAAHPKSLPNDAMGSAPSRSAPSGSASLRLPIGYANPQGPQGECTIMMRTFKGWFPEEHGAKGYPTDCFRSFNLPQDLKHFENRLIESVADEYLASHGVTTALGVRLVKMARTALGENAELKRKLEHFNRRDAQKEKLIKEQAAALKKLSEADKAAQSRVKEIEEELAII